MRRLEGKVAIITGSSEGIGFKTAERLAKEGAQVVITSRKDYKVKAAVDTLRELGLDVFGIPCHVGKPLERARLIDGTIKRYGKIDILVVNAASNPAIKDILQTDEGEWDHIFHVNLKSSFMIAQETIPHIRKQLPGGNIVFISSIGAYIPLEFAGAYSVSKTALIGLAKAIAMEVANQGIRVNCVACGGVKTKFIDQISDEHQKAFLKKVPMNRPGLPEEIASVVAFLVSEDASYITGECIVPSGGVISRL